MKRACYLCGEREHIRPYGPKGAYVCGYCRERDPAIAEMWDREFDRRFRECLAKGNCVIMTRDGPIPGIFTDKGVERK